MQGSDETLVISGARWKSIARFLGSIAVIALCLWLSFGDVQLRRHDPNFVKIVGVSCCVIFAWTALHNLWQAIRPPRLLLTAQGFQFIGIRKPIVVRWDDVETFDVAEITRSRFAAFRLRAGSEAIRDQWITREVTPEFDGLIAVSPSYGPERLVEILSEWLSRYGSASQIRP